MEKKSYVYVVSWNQVWDSNEISNSNKVFASKEDAFKFYEDFKKDEMESINKKGVGDDWVESDGNWESKENGNTDLAKMNVVRRVCGYLGNANYMAQGRMGDIHDRVKHL